MKFACLHILSFTAALLCSYSSEIHLRKLLTISSDVCCVLPFKSEVKELEFENLEEKKSRNGSRKDLVNCGTSINCWQNHCNTECITKPKATQPLIETELHVKSNYNKIKQASGMVAVFSFTLV